MEVKNLVEKLQKGEIDFEEFKEQSEVLISAATEKAFQLASKSPKEELGDEQRIRSLADKARTL